MKHLYLLLSVALAAVLSAAGALFVTPLVASAIQDRVKAATHIISTQTLTEDGNCSATAIAPHALLTASHCESPTDLLSIDGVPGHKVTAIIRDGSDHSIFLMPGTTFDAFVPLAAPPREFHSDEAAFIWGNPWMMGVVYVKQFRQGKYRASRMEKSRIVDLLDLKGQLGDSGSGVFSQSSGDLLGVVSFVGTIPIPPKGDAVEAVGAVRLAFTKAELERAAAFK